MILRRITRVWTGVDFFSKLRAAALHFLVSVAVFSGFISVLYFYWYPQPYFSASGGWQGLKLVAFVDLVLGPLLTFIAFNKNKAIRILAQDLVLIGLLQISALVWGIYLVYQQRPLAIVFWESSFYTVPYQALRHYRDTAHFAKLVAEPRQLLYAEKPHSVAGLEEMLERTKQLNLPPHHQLEYYRPLAGFFQEMQRYTLDIDEIIEHNPKMASQLERILAETDTQLQQNIYLPVQSRYRNIVLVFTSEGEQLGFLEAPYKKNEQL